MIGGCDVSGLAATYGTPLFVYDEAHLRARCREAVAAFGDGVAYAAKAFLCTAMARLVHEEGMRIDVASGGELFVALKAGVPADRLVLHGNNKSDEELIQARDAGVGRIVVDSFDELERLRRLAGFGHPRPRVLLRLTPGVEAHTHEFIATGHEDVKFGFSIASGAAMEAVAKCRSEGRHCRPTGPWSTAWDSTACRVTTPPSLCKSSSLSMVPVKQLRFFASRTGACLASVTGVRRSQLSTARPTGL